MTRTSRLLVVLALFLLPMTAAAQETDDATIALVERYLAARQAESGIPGMTAAIVQGDQVVFIRGFGTAGPDDATATAETPFLIASLSKSVTAMALMQLVESGAIDLDVPVSTYLPELSTGDRVTVRQVMHHKSGLSNLLGVEPFWNEELAPDLTRNVERLSDQFEADAPHEYSNANYDVLALLIERVSGMPFGEYLQENLFEPLEMDNSHVDQDRPTQPGLAQGHYHWLFFGYLPRAPFMPPGLPGSHTMFASAEDMTHFLIAQLNDGSYNGTQVVSASSIATLHEPDPYDDDTELGYGGGLRIEPPGTPFAPEAMAEATTLWHDGSSDSYRSVLWMIPEMDLGFVILANGNDIVDEGYLPAVAQNVKLLLLGEETFDIENSTDFLTLWSKHLLFLVAAGQLIFALYSARPMAKLRDRQMTRGTRVFLWAATLLDLVALGLVAYVIPTVSELPLRAATTLPDYRIIILTMIAGIVWGVIRTAVVVFWLVRRRSADSVPA